MNYKGYLITYSKTNPHSLTIATEGQGGKIPNVLQGFFTNYTVAKEAVDNYLENRVVRNAKENSKSGD